MQVTKFDFKYTELMVFKWKKNVVSKTLDRHI